VDRERASQHLYSGIDGDGDGAYGVWHVDIVVSRTTRKGEESAP